MNATLEAILGMIAYHDQFDFPLTAQEIFLGSGAASLDGVLSALRSDDGRRLFGDARGFHFLKGRDAVVSARLHRYDLAEEKYAKVLRFVRMIRRVPFLRAVFVCNTLARSDAREGSDLDLFVVCAPGRIWTVRLLATGLAALLGIRPTAHDAADGICLSFFIDGARLDLSGVAVARDAYLPHWIADLMPVYDEDGTSARVPAANAALLKGLPHAAPPSSVPRRSVPPPSLPIKRAVERLIGGRLEARAKAVQLRRLPASLKEAASRGTGVVLSDAMLKFHDRDRREEIRDRFEKTMNDLHAFRAV